MIPGLRHQFNESFTPERYASFLEELEEYAGEKIPFRIAETPVFIPGHLYEKLDAACEYIIDVIRQPDFKQITDKAIPAHHFVPGDEENPMWMAFDFGICKDESGELVPMLIELQGFPSLFFYQHILAEAYRHHFRIGQGVNHLFGRNEEDYLVMMKELLLNNHDPENVILMDIEPENQNTRIDFTATFKNTGIQAVCISDVLKEGRKLFYNLDGRKIPIYRIYNRVIFDELLHRSDLDCEFNLTEGVDVEWAGHPNWFFRISKYILPILKSPFVPPTQFVSDIRSIPGDLENYVLKPLFSFSGSGVVFHVKKQDIESIKDPENWILQRKVNYEPVISSPEGMIKTEIRMLYCWQPGKSSPEKIINLVRLSQGEMIGVKYNTDKSWVGSSVGFFEKIKK